MTQESEIVFQNFNHKVELQQHKSDYQVVGKQISVALTNRVIVKTKKGLIPQQLLALDSKIINLHQLYTANSFNYYSVVVKSQKDLFAMITKLQNLPEVILVQPDILQLTIRNEQVVELNTKNNTAQIPNDILYNYYKSIGIMSLWEKTKGSGIKVAIIDDGFNLEHQDLRQLNLSFSYDISGQKSTVLPKKGLDNHGTKVAGIIFAQHNNVGIDGIAPEASLIAIRQPSTWTSETLLSFQLAQLAGADIINCSWNSQWLLQPIADVVNDLTSNGRQGKGVVVVFSAGNKGKLITAHTTESSILSAVVVAANNLKTKTNIKGQYQRLKISNYGDSVDLFFMGNKVNTTLATGGYGYFAGTSLSAAIVSGFSALLLSQNPQLNIKQLTKKLKMVNQ